MRLPDKVAIVTGAAGAGIGQATARALVRKDASVVISDVHAKRAFSVAKEITEISKGNVKGIPRCFNEKNQTQSQGCHVRYKPAGSIMC